MFLRFSENCLTYKYTASRLAVSVAFTVQYYCYSWAAHNAYCLQTQMTCPLGRVELPAESACAPGAYLCILCPYEGKQISWHTQVCTFQSYPGPARICWLIVVYYLQLEARTYDGTKAGLYGYMDASPVRYPLSSQCSNINKSSKGFAQFVFSGCKINVTSLTSNIKYSVH